MNSGFVGPAGRLGPGTTTAKAWTRTLLTPLFHMCAYTILTIFSDLKYCYKSPWARYIHTSQWGYNWKCVMWLRCEIWAKILQEWQFIEAGFKLYLKLVSHMTGGPTATICHRLFEYDQLGVDEVSIVFPWFVHWSAFTQLCPTAITMKLKAKLQWHPNMYTWKSAQTILKGAVPTLVHIFREFHDLSRPTCFANLPCTILCMCRAPERTINYYTKPHIRNLLNSLNSIVIEHLTSYL